MSRFCSMIETQFGKKVKKIWSDNAKEFALSELCHQRGILHQYSCVQRPEQNSVVERKHQHLLNVARSLYFQSRGPAQFWGECITSTFLINRTSSSQLHNKTPYELLHNTTFYYTTLGVFGCLGFASTLPAHHDKFQPRAALCVLLGYHLGVKGLKMYDIQRKTVFISRDVVFHENIFPFHSISTPESLIDPFMI